MLAHELPLVLPVTPDGGKVARAARVIPLTAYPRFYSDNSDWNRSQSEEAQRETHRRRGCRTIRAIYGRSSVASEISCSTVRNTTD